MLDQIAQMPVVQVPHQAPIRLSSRALTRVAVRAMRDGRQGAAVIEDAKGFLVGLFTERNALQKLDLSNDSWKERPVVDFMSQDRAPIRTDTTLADAIDLMHRGPFRHLAIVDDYDHAVGILSIRDVMVFVVEHFPEHFANLPIDPAREARLLYGG